MELVVDANIIISALIATEGRTYDLIFNERLKLFAPEFLFEEIEKHKQEIASKAGLDEYDFGLFLSLISINIDIIPKYEFEKFISKAKTISPDINDTEYFALALKLGCGLWSNEKKLKNQDKLKVYSTAELNELF